MARKDSGLNSANGSGMETKMHVLENNIESRINRT